VHDQPDTRYAKSGELNIGYQVLGDGPLDVVFVPGLLSHIDLVWGFPAATRFFRRLAAFSRVIVYDKRGQGISDPPGGVPTLEDDMEDLRAILDTAGSQRAALFGYSEGGPMSALFAATYPDRVTALILFGTFARGADLIERGEKLRPRAHDPIVACWSTGERAAAWRSSPRASSRSTGLAASARSSGPSPAPQCCGPAGRRPLAST
jgi:pimeloyl-ACP methyl ester carboxylesterase